LSGIATTASSIFTLTASHLSSRVIRKRGDAADSLLKAALNSSRQDIAAMYPCEGDDDDFPERKDPQVYNILYMEDGMRVYI
jgi:hypothetical protein